MKWVTRRYRRFRHRLAAVAATLFYDIIVYHTLIDCNKRLATLALYTFLIKNNYIVPRRGVYKLALLVAKGEIDKEGVYKWLLENLKPLHGKKP